MFLSGEQLICTSYKIASGCQAGWACHVQKWHCSAVFLLTVASNEAACNVGKSHRDVWRQFASGAVLRHRPRDLVGTAPGCRVHLTPSQHLHALPPGPPPPLPPALLPSKSAVKGNYFWLSELLSVNLHPSGFMHSLGLWCQCAAEICFYTNWWTSTLVGWDISQCKCWSVGDQQPTWGRFSVTDCTFPGYCQLLYPPYSSPSAAFPDKSASPEHPK